MMKWVLYIVKKNVHPSLKVKKFILLELCYGVLKIVLLKKKKNKLVKQDLLD